MCPLVFETGALIPEGSRGRPTACIVECHTYVAFDSSKYITTKEIRKILLQVNR